MVGDDTILVTVDAYECIVCGNRLYDEAAGQRVQAARERLERGDIGDMRAVGTVYRAQ